MVSLMTYYLTIDFYLQHTYLPGVVGESQVIIGYVQWVDWARLDIYPLTS